jgi:hypothetical protein
MAILLVDIDGYEWLMMIILLMAIDVYSINVY